MNRKSLGTSLALACGFLLIAVPLRAAETTFFYGGSAGITYSQDVFRTGDNNVDDYITGIGLDAGVLSRTPRSSFNIRYSPAYLHYAEFDTLDYLEHRLASEWEFRTGKLSSFELRQGFSDTNRQVGFQDFAGAGGNSGEPVVGRTQRVAWDLEPKLTVTPSSQVTVTAGAVYREEHYDRPTLIDSRQLGVSLSADRALKKSQALGGRISADTFRFETGLGRVQNGFDQFLNASMYWSTRTLERMSLTAGAGVFRGSGQGVNPTTGPRFDLSGSRLWRRSQLSVDYLRAYSSGGGVSAAQGIQQGLVTYSGQWGRDCGFQVGVSYLHLDALPGAILAAQALNGRSSFASISKRWLSGFSLSGGVNTLRQEQNLRASLSYGEVRIGVTYSRPRPAKRAETPVP